MYFFNNAFIGNNIYKFYTCFMYKLFTTAKEKFSIDSLTPQLLWNALVDK